eukprot:768804-Hanusia_phi.AAC.2
MGGERTREKQRGRRGERGGKEPCVLPDGSRQHGDLVICELELLELSELRGRENEGSEDEDVEDTGGEVVDEEDEAGSKRSGRQGVKREKTRASAGGSPAI